MATLKLALIKWAVINFNFNQKFHLDFRRWLMWPDIFRQRHIEDH